MRDVRDLAGARTGSSARSGGPSPRPSSRCARARPLRCDVRADERRERAARADAAAAAAGRGANCALPSDCFSNATASTRSWHAAPRRGATPTMPVVPPTAAGGVHAEHRLAGRAERVGEVQLGLHRRPRTGRAPCRGRPRRCRPTSSRASSSARERGLADEPAERDVAAALLVVRLADADDRARFAAHVSPPPGCRRGSVAGTAPTSRARARAACRRRRSALRRLGDADEAGRHDRVGGERRRPTG